MLMASGSEMVSRKKAAYAAAAGSRLPHNYKREAAA